MGEAGKAAEACYPPGVGGIAAEWMMLKVVAAVSAVAAVVACGRTPEAQDKLYRIEVEQVSVRAGGTASPTVRFVPSHGFHWNEEFPAKVRVGDAGGVVPVQAEYRQSAGDFKVSDGAGVLSLKFETTSPGPKAVKLLADFSMCDEKTCQIYRGVSVEVPIDVQ